MCNSSEKVKPKSDAKSIEKWTLTGVVFNSVIGMSAIFFTIHMWFSAERDLVKTSTALNETSSALNVVNTELSNTQISLTETEKNLAEVNVRLGEIKIVVEEISADNIKLDSALKAVELDTKSVRDKLLMAKEVRESAQILTPNISIKNMEIGPEDKFAAITWEIENIGKSTVEIIMLDFQVSKTPLLFTKLSIFKARKIFQTITGDTSEIQDDKNRIVSLNNAEFTHATDAILEPNVVFSYPSSVPSKQTTRYQIQFALDSPEPHKLYFFRAIFGVRTIPRELELYLNILEPDKDDEIRLTRASSQVIQYKDNFRIGGPENEWGTIENFISAKLLEIKPYPIEIKLAQWNLNWIGYCCNKADGILGPKTRETIKQYQLDHGMPTTGKLDVRTMTSITNAGNKVIKKE
ncbi:peptidoglycan-binding domain-containing protein [Aliiglaciecola sp. 3_MG-2023]|uniref:peptidoglycan-binding domain-containing protein n=1 Tax=Aliiglaciecola sp. 3_MG-2023 TaxID=3062644 RepID=UPI0026E4500E|nr:peptidoglycan-binding domain-containing protein [Aliiglaciecola sp. 3_MG-2023]MDO6692183.1 peptidoglycan-binding domain-containing protein [Aliiglaciecola sp. 3_MG-2023]